MQEVAASLNQNSKSLESILCLNHATCYWVLPLTDNRCSLTQVSDSSCTSNTVDILLYVAGQVKVYNMFHIGDVQTPSCYLIM